MNRLIIIGNGFDLAHGLKTSYKDFMSGYSSGVFEDALEKGKYEDDFISLKKRSGGWFNDDEVYLDLFGKNDVIKNLLQRQSQEYLQEGIYNPFEDIDIKNNFLKKLFISSCDHWVDIEEFFYKELVKAVKREKIENENDESGLKGYEESVTKINEGMRHLTKALGDYLKKEVKSYKIKNKSKRIPFAKWGNFAHYLNYKSYLKESGSFEEADLQTILFLNFNYTDTIHEFDQSMFNSNVNAKLDFIDIHGNVFGTSGPMIFGYGDEIDKNYKLLEEENYNSLLDYFKSFGYFQTNNYRKLERFINADLFDVFIMGHSCGLSDRVMLNTIFEHEHCEAIKLFYHKRGEDDDNYIELTQNISRHFVDKKKMRNRVVSKEDSMPLNEII